MSIAICNYALMASASLSKALSLPDYMAASWCDEGEGVTKSREWLTNSREWLTNSREYLATAQLIVGVCLAVLGSAGIFSAALVRPGATLIGHCVYNAVRGEIMANPDHSIFSALAVDAFAYSRTGIFSAFSLFF
jgi:hypothetical protein